MRDIRKKYKMDTGIKAPDIERLQLEILCDATSGSEEVGNISLDDPLLQEILNYIEWLELENEK